MLAAAEVGIVEVAIVSVFDWIRELAGRLISDADRVGVAVVEAADEPVSLATSAVLVAVTSSVVHAVKVSVAIPLPSSTVLVTAASLSVATLVSMDCSVWDVVEEAEPLPIGVSVATASTSVGVGLETSVSATTVVLTPVADASIDCDSIAAEA